MDKMEHDDWLDYFDDNRFATYNATGEYTIKYRFVKDKDDLDPIDYNNFVSIAKHIPLLNGNSYSSQLHTLCKIHKISLCLCSKCKKIDEFDKEKFISIAGSAPIESNVISYTDQLHHLCQEINLKVCHCFKCDYLNNMERDKFISIAGSVPISPCESHDVSYTLQLHDLCQEIGLKVCHCMTCDNANTVTYGDDILPGQFDLFIDI